MTTYNEQLRQKIVNRFYTETGKPEAGTVDLRTGERLNDHEPDAIEINKAVYNNSKDKLMSPWFTTATSA